MLIDMDEPSVNYPLVGVLGVVICVALASTRTLCLRAWAAPVHIDTGFKPCRHDMRVQPLLPLSY